MHLHSSGVLFPLAIRMLGHIVFTFPHLTTAEVKPNAFAPKPCTDEKKIGTNEPELKPEIRKKRAKSSRSTGSSSRPKGGKAQNRSDSLASRALDDYDPAAAPKSRFVIRDEYFSTHSELSTTSRKGKEKQDTQAHRVEIRDIPRSNKTTTRPLSTTNERKRLELRNSDTESSSDIDVDWSSSSMVTQNCSESEDDDPMNEMKIEASTVQREKRLSSSNQHLGIEDGQEDEGNTLEALNGEDDGRDVVDGEEIGLERGKKYKLVIEKIPTPPSATSTSLPRGPGSMCLFCHSLWLHY